MTDQQHPTPPPELVEQLRREAPHGIRDAGVTRELHLIAAAYRAGADQQLEQCVDWLEGYERDGWAAEQMRSGCRPHPPSLKKQALALLQPGEPRLFNSEMQAILRRALEALDD